MGKLAFPRPPVTAQQERQGLRYSSDNAAYPTHPLDDHVMELSKQYPDYGYRKISALAKAQGKDVSTRRARRVLGVG